MSLKEKIADLLDALADERDQTSPPNQESSNNDERSRLAALYETATGCEADEHILDMLEAYPELKETILKAATTDTLGDAVSEKKAAKASSLSKQERLNEAARRFAEGIARISSKR
jgi:hypothetical protein